VPVEPTPQTCRSCGAPLFFEFVDLGFTPPSNALVRPEAVLQPEVSYPLRALVCEACFLVQLEDYVVPEDIFRDYVYFSSYSKSWLAHAAAYVETISEEIGLGPKSFVVEIASNDGYLLKNFVTRGVPCLGIEPAENVAKVARENGVPTESIFFGRQTAQDLRARHGPADLIVANNVMAHVPDLDDFIAGLAELLAPNGWATIEAPHFLTLLEGNQFDTIYHEHFSYLSLLSVEAALGRHGLHVADVAQLPTHGGSLRYFVRRSSDAGALKMGGALATVREMEQRAHLDSLDGYRGFKARVQAIKLDLLRFLVDASREGKTVACYGAAAKGNTLLNYCGVDRDLIAFVVDRNPTKQGCLLPGSRIPVLPPEAVFESRPDYLLILPWNLRDEIMSEMAGVRDWGCKFAWAIPEMEVTA
jgi:SAM-dependent methyltransferase